jgi:hypothetical protein
MKFRNLHLFDVAGKRSLGDNQPQFLKFRREFFLIGDPAIPY